jgi:hypothetical protein
MTALAAGFHPGGSGGTEFPFPDWNAGLYGLDSGPTGRERLGPVWGGRGDGDGDLADPEGSNPMAENDLRLRVSPGEILGNAGHFAFGHGAIRLVLEVVHAAAFVVVPHDAHEQRQSPVPVPPHGVEKGARVERAVREEGHRNMIRPSLERER